MFFLVHISYGVGTIKGMFTGRKLTELMAFYRDIAVKSCDKTYYPGH